MKKEKTLVFSLALMLVIGSIAFAGVGFDLSSGLDIGLEEGAFIEGSGTRDDPTMIYDIYDLQDMKNDLTAHYALANDIDASDTINWNSGEGFEPVGRAGSGGVRFSGSLDGRGYTISDLYINRSSGSYIGLFGSVATGGMVGDVILKDVHIEGAWYVGALVGENLGTVYDAQSTGYLSKSAWYLGGIVGLNDGDISDSHSWADCFGGSMYTGGLVGLNRGAVSNSSAGGNIFGSNTVGGLVGRSEGVVMNSHANGDVSGGYYIGGLVGTISIDSVVSHSSATGNVSSSGVYIGGLIGYIWNDALVKYSFATGDVTGPQRIGGLLGYSEGTVKYSYATGRIDGTEDHGSGVSKGVAGGLIGEMKEDAVVLECHTTGDVHGVGHVGGLIGLNHGSVKDSNSIGEITGTGSHVGGLVGYNVGSIHNSSSAAHVVGYDTNTGGLVGYNTGSINRSFATGEVTSTASSTGGLVGSTFGGYILDSYSTGNVIGASNAGGLIGSNHGLIRRSFTNGSVDATGDGVGGFTGHNGASGMVENSHASGDVHGNNNVGGFVGWNNMGAIRYSYSIGTPTAVNTNVAGFAGRITTGDNYEDTANFWDTVTSGMETSPMGTGKNTDEMMSEDTFIDVGWDFDDVWWMIEGETYPLLWHQGWPGTKFNPYMIRTVHELQEMENDLAAYYVLANDIDASETSGWNGGSGFDPIGNGLDVQFTGGFDGKGYTISDLYINRDVPYIGLFGHLDGAEIRDVGLVDVDITGTDQWSGGLVGRNWEGTVYRSYVTGNVSGDSFVGGVVGSNMFGTVSGCLADVNVQGAQDVGGAVGYNRGIVIDSYSRGPVTRSTGSNTFIAGFVGHNFRAKVINCYSTGSVHYQDAADPTDKGFCGGVFTGGDYEMTGNFWDTETSGQTGTWGDAIGLPTVDMMDLDTFTTWDIVAVQDEYHRDLSYVWNMVDGATYPFLSWEFAEEPPFAGGSGNETDPYLVQNWHHLYNVRYHMDEHFMLINDLDELSEGYNDYNEADGWLPIGTSSHRFKGVFHGDGYAIISLYINRPLENEVGLFGYLGDTAVVSELNFTALDVTGGEYVGGLAGVSSGIVFGCHVFGTISGEHHVGGLFGLSADGNISRSGSVVEVYSSGDCAGGLIGLFAGGTPLENTHAQGIVTGKNLIGGLVGESKGTISRSHFIGDVKGNEIIGGLVGQNKDTIESSYASGNVTGFSDLGGLAGVNEGTIADSRSSSNVVGTSDNAGGLVGRNERYSFVFGSHATGDVTGNDCVGGLVGLNTIAQVSGSYSSGAVIRGYDDVGGLVGRNTNGILNNTYALGDIKGNNFIGGLVGFNDQGYVAHSYSTGEPMGEEKVGGLTGHADTGGNYADKANYWDVETSDIDQSAMGTGKHTVEMRTRATFIDSDWDFIQVWKNQEGVGYPILRWQNGEGTYEDPYWISTVECLQSISTAMDAHYLLANDIDAAVTDGWNDGAGFTPIGDFDQRFSGSINGNSYVITGLYIDRPAVDHAALIGYLDVDGVLTGITLIDTEIVGKRRVGGLAGYGLGTVEGCHVHGDISGELYVGGLVGTLLGGTISHSSTSGNVTGDNDVGGLLGTNEGTVLGSYSDSDVTGSSRIGGLVGYNLFDSTVENSYATGDVEGTSNIGGFVGRNREGMIRYSYSAGQVTGGDHTGGFAGRADTEGSYEDIGNFWDTEISGREGSAMGTGKYTGEMKTQDTFTVAGWDFTDTWHMVGEVTYPLLRWQGLPERTTTPIGLSATSENGGWNFVSLSLVMEDTSIEIVLNSIEGSYDRVMWYDSSEDVWRSYVPSRAAHYNNLRSLDRTMGVWIRMTTNDVLMIEGYTPMSTDIILRPGWNMVGFPSSTAGNHELPYEVDRVGYFDASNGYNVAYDYDPANFVFEPGHGYWIYNLADYDVVWTVEY